MYWQRKLERTSVSMTLGNTYKLLLPYQGMLGSLLIKVSGAEATGLGAAAQAWRINDFISQIQVVLNGSIVCKSLTGYEVQALGFHDQGVMMPDDWRNYATNVQYAYFLINFGRWFKDDQMGLDLSAYSSAELWITNTGAAATWGDLTTTIMGFYLQDAPGVQWNSYMRTEEWQVWTTVADAWQYNNLPTELAIRRIMLQAVPLVDGNFIATTGMINLMDEVRFGLKTNNILVYDGSLEMLMRENFLDDGKPAIAVGWPYTPNGHGIRMDIGYALGAMAGGGTQAGTVTTVDPTIDSARSDYTQVGYSYLADHPNSLWVYGMSPYNTVIIKTHEYDDPATYLDPLAQATVKLDIHTRNAASAAGGRNAIILDRLQQRGK